MSIVLLFVGAIIGGAFEGAEGALLGGVVGFMLGLIQQLSLRISRLEKQLAALSLKFGQATFSPAPEQAPAAPTNVTPTYSPPPQPLKKPTPPLTSTRVTDEALEQSPAAADPHEDVAESQTSPNSFSIYDLWSRGVDWIVTYFTGGNPAVRIGVIVLFFGVAFLLKYAAEHAKLPIEARLIGVALGSIVMLVIGWRLRLSRASYAVVLQGGGVGLLYMTVFAALRLYSLISPLGALLIMLAVVVFSAVLALLQNARSLAVLGTIGGFLAPILTSSGDGNHVLLFSYFSLLNVGIVIIAWYKSWRILNFIGFIFTFVLGVLWGHTAYRPEHFSSTEPFLILSFLFYTTIAVLFALRNQNRPDYIDGTLMFGTPIIVFALQANLIGNYRYGLSLSALGFGLFYLLLTKWVLTRNLNSVRMLSESLLALGIIFGTLAIPLALDARWTSAAWAVEGAGLLWLGVRNNKSIAQIFGVALQVLAGLAFYKGWGLLHGTQPVLNSVYMGCAIISLTGFFSSYLLYKYSERIPEARSIGVALLVWAILWWYGGAMWEIDLRIEKLYQPHAFLIFASLSSAVLLMLSQRLHWRWLDVPALSLLVVMVMIAALTAVLGHHPSAHLGYAAWPLTFTIYYWILYQNRTRHTDLKLAHAATLWLLVALISWEIAWNVDRLVEGAKIWRITAWALPSALLLLSFNNLRKRITWPLNTNEADYTHLGLAPLAVFLILWSVITNFTQSGDPSPLLYLPFLNPLDVVQALILLAILKWSAIQRGISPTPEASISHLGILRVIALAGLIWTTAILVRSLHAWGNVGFSRQEIFNSVLVQAGVSILWTLIAFATMFIATKRGSRTLWIAGATLAAVVVVKLFIIDLSNTGTIARIVSFIGVGVLLLVAGYFSPVPPRTAGEK